jgi:hypothetical protein
VFFFICCATVHHHALFDDKDILCIDTLSSCPGSRGGFLSHVHIAQPVPIFVSFANFVSTVTSSACTSNLLIKTKNNTGSNTERCGTPEITCPHPEDFLFSFLPAGQFHIYPCTFHPTPCTLSFIRSLFFGHLIEGLYKAKEDHVLIIPSVQAQVTVSRTRGGSRHHMGRLEKVGVFLGGWTRVRPEGKTPP